MINPADSSASGFLTEEYEGLSRVFADVEQMPSAGYCDLYRANVRAVVSAEVSAAGASGRPKT